MQRDSVEVTLQARITANATAFEAGVGVAGEDLLQGVRPYGQNAATVFVPSVAAGGALIRRVEVPPLQEVRPSHYAACHLREAISS